MGRNTPLENLTQVFSGLVLGEVSTKAQIQTNNKMRVITFLFTFILCIISSLASPLQLGYGGVYNSPAASAYWARRFGGIFGENLSGLAALQANIDTQGVPNNGHPVNGYGKRSADKASPAYNRPADVPAGVLYPYGGARFTVSDVSASGAN